MSNNGVKILPSGLVTCLIGERELRIISISPDSIALRASGNIGDIDKLRIAFYIFEENRYDEVIINNFKIISIEEKEFSTIYSMYIDDKTYKDSVYRIFRNYSKYVTLRNYGEEGEFSEEMVGYPAEEDYKFKRFFSDMKRHWMLDCYYDEYNEEELLNTEFAISLHNDSLYKKYMSLGIDKFFDSYVEDNYIGNHKLFNNNISRIYVGNEFCHNLFPEVNMLLKIMDKAVYEGLDVTVCFTYMRDNLIENATDTIEKIYNWSVKNNKQVEIVINDWGMLNILKGKEDFLTPVLGVLLNKRKKDPRIRYKNGFEENMDMLSENSLNSALSRDFLKQYGIKRFEYESCGYRMKIAEGKHSMHLPYYVTNLSQYCPLNAMCTTMDRGNQRLVNNCPKYCNDYMFAYPNHLKMAGIYNGLFSIDASMLKDFTTLKYYIKNGIDRIVFNFM